MTTEQIELTKLGTDNGWAAEHRSVTELAYKTVRASGTHEKYQERVVSTIFTKDSERVEISWDRGGNIQSIVTPKASVQEGDPSAARAMARAHLSF